MANFSKANAKLENCSLAFTLPIACQICLGKVKQPVVCPNQHVFCHGCMDVWLKRNQKCPACRIPISQENPCRPIIGGVNVQPENDQSFSSRELRRARTELLFKEYETEIERLENEMLVCRHDNEQLRHQVQGQLDTRSCDSSSKTAPSGGHEVAMLGVLTTKPQEAAAQSEKMKAELKKLKQASSSLAEENENLRRENQRLRLELTGRSPRKYGRYTVATLESKVESYEKEARQLQKALERSDSYIEELQRDLSQAKKSQTLGVQNGGRKPVETGTSASVRKTRHCDFDETDDTVDVSLVSPQKTNSGRHMQATRTDESSFQLEMPSPVSPDLVKQCFGDREEGSRSCKKRLEFMLDGPSSGEPFMSKFSKLDTADISVLSLGSPPVDRGRSSAVKRDLFAVPSCDTTMDTLEPTMNESDLCLNSDLSDCMKLLDAAEKNVEQRRSSEVLSQSASSKHTVWR